jgi:hypothetical protein
MKRFLNNAEQQFKQFGQVVIHYYTDRTYENIERFNFTTLEEAQTFIQDIMSNEQDNDIHVPAPEWFDNINVPKP